MSTPSTVRPDVIFIDELLNSVSQGTLRVPKFQRPFVWTPKQMADLFDSIRQGYPIGSLLFWETSDEVLTLEKIGPVNFPAAASSSIQLVLDGHQRLSTLFGVLRSPGKPKCIDNQDQHWKWHLYFDLRAEEFVHSRRTPVPPHFLKLSALLRTINFLSECRRIDIECSDAALLIDKAEVLAQQVKGYKLPINVVKGDLRKAVETFSRMNTKGRPMTVDQMMSALTYREGSHAFHLDSRIGDILSMLSKRGFGGVTRRTIFRIVVASLEMDVYRTDWSRVSKEISGALPQLVQECELALGLAIDFLKNELGVVCYRLLPYEPQLMILSEFFRNCSSPTHSQRSLLRKWFWATSFSTWFAGASDSTTNRTLQDFRSLALEGDSESNLVHIHDKLIGMPETLNMRGARVRAYLLFLASLEPRDLRTGEPIDVETELLAKGSEAMEYVFQNEKGTPENRLLVGSHVPPDLLPSILSADPAWLNSHAIDTKALCALRNGNVQGFLSARRAQLESLEGGFSKARLAN